MTVAETDGRRTCPVHRGVCGAEGDGKSDVHERCQAIPR